MKRKCIDGMGFVWKSHCTGCKLSGMKDCCQCGEKFDI